MVRANLESEAGTHGPLTVGPYSIVELLGRGGMGVVYKAWDERLGRHVALKNILAGKAASPEARQRFLREARMAARLDHPALVPVHDFLELDDGDWIVMEYIEGESLTLRLEAGSLPWVDTLSIARQVADGLTAIHAAGILHRDLKSENVIVSEPRRQQHPPAESHRGRVRILDFGLARQGDGEDSLSATGAWFGTPRVMSPEQARGEELTPASDLFAFGVLLYEMLTGRSPFLGAGPFETLAKVCHDFHEPVGDLVPGLPPSLAALVDRLLSKDPTGRPAGAGLVFAELERIAETIPAADTEPRREVANRSSLREPGSGGASEGALRRQGERRQLVVLCCELVEKGESAADDTSGSLDPEVLFEVLPDFRELSLETLGRYEGHLGDFQGHRLVALFGFPQAREDDSRRALLAGLDMIAWGGRLISPGDGRPALAVRVGIHAGPAVVLDTPGRGERLVLGQSLDQATALQEHADPGSVVVGESTHRLVDGLFESHPLAPSGPTTDAMAGGAIRITGARPIHSPLEEGGKLPPPIGRERELELLANRFELAGEGSAQVVTISGEAGMGKTRLVRALRDRLGAEGVSWLSIHGARHRRQRPLAPVADLVRQLLGIAPGRSRDEEHGLLLEALERFELPVAEAEGPLVSLFELSRSESGSTDVRRRHAVVSWVPELVLEVAERRAIGGKTTVLVIENLQWLDPASLELSSRLVDQSMIAPILLVLTCRPAFREPWRARAHTTRLCLAPLDRDRARELIRRLSAPRRLAEKIETSILSRADGNPLFVEALTRQGPGSEEPDERTLPPALESLLHSRLDRLGTAKELAQLAAILGPELSYQTLRALGDLDPPRFEHELGRLLEAGVLVSEGGDPGGRLGFGHPLLREATLATLLEEDRVRIERHWVARGRKITLDMPQRS